ncbi:hypothetical protein BDY24DRAFT_398625 [Mrakia frigida]|uniref:uncharacterized protein n=1 Tax=Mrakia frigida TaxID=29902 RepID=UPI003FCBF07A
MRPLRFLFADLPLPPSVPLPLLPDVQSPNPRDRTVRTSLDRVHLRPPPSLRRQTRRVRSRPNPHHLPPSQTAQIHPHLPPSVRSGLFFPIDHHHHHPPTFLSFPRIPHSTSIGHRRDDDDGLGEDGRRRRRGRDKRERERGRGGRTSRGRVFIVGGSGGGGGRRGRIGRWRHLGVPWRGLVGSMVGRRNGGYGGARFLLL